MRFVHPSTDIPYYNQRNRYFVEMLELALRKSGQAFTIESVKLPPMRESRSSLFLTSGRYNVHWLMTNNNHEDDLLPIRIPLFKGLIGWRLFFIREDSAEAFNNINDIAGLQSKTAAQGLDWPDASILQSGRFPLRMAQDWTSLLEITARKRADYFPRGVTEIWRELPAAHQRGLMVEQHLVLHYTAAYYFFVSKKNPAHAKLIEKGLRIALADGSFDVLFEQNFGEDLRKAKLSERRVLHINNPLLPPHTPRNDPALWYRPEDRQ